MLFLFSFCRVEEERILTEAVPEKYFVITNNDIVRVRYILAYGEHTRRLLGVYNSRMYRWVVTHKAATTLIMYGIFLVIIGNGQQALYIKHVVSRVSQAVVVCIKDMGVVGFNYLQKLFKK